MFFSIARSFLLLGFSPAPGVAFGLARGATVLAGWRIDDPDALVSFHRRLQERAGWGRLAAVAADSGILNGVVVVLWRGA